MTKGIDCAVPLTAAKAKAIYEEGYRFAARYLVPARYAWKRLTRAEVEVITAAGMQVVSVFEASASRPKGGATAGQTDGREALAEARLIGQPADSAIYFAVDYDAQPQDYDAIEAYLRAAGAAIMGNRPIDGYYLGVYGSYAVVEEMARRIPGIHIWQTYAWSRGKKSDKANIWQYRNDIQLAGHTLDLNESYGGEGWWNTKEEEPMLEKTDAEKIVKILQAAWQIDMGNAIDVKLDRTEINRLANEVRKVGGIPLG